MSYTEIILLALVLSIDACVVSFSYGISFTQNRLKNATLLAFFTGFFQAFMPVIGYFFTDAVKNHIAPYSSWVVFTIFVFLGVKFIKEAFKKNQAKPLCIGIVCLLLIGVATSIDAFSAGITLSLYGNKILKPALLIGIITFINSCFGFTLGGKMKNLPASWLEVVGGLVLIILGLKAII